MNFSKLLVEKGAPITVSSDSHFPDDLEITQAKMQKC